MAGRPLVTTPIEYGNNESFWVEYPSGLVDLSRSHHLNPKQLTPPDLKDGQTDFQVDWGRTVRIDNKSTAMVIVDMQNFFLHPELRDHPTGLKCIEPLMRAIPVLRSIGSKILWVNWGLTENDLETLPPSLSRSFKKGSGGGFGSPLPGKFGRLLMRDAFNSELYGVLQDEYLKGKRAGSDFWIHKNRMGGLWGSQGPLDLFLKENGITTLLFGGVNTDQCVLGTLMDAYFTGYDCILVQDVTATTSPEGGLASVVYNSRNSYGFVTDTARLLAIQ